MPVTRIRRLENSDLPAVMRLKEAAGWNQTEDDWGRLLLIEPEGCFGLEQDGVLAATATAVTYGADLAWIGMVLTLPEFRGRGFARGLMEHAVAFAESRGVAAIALDATDMGIALYRQFGFLPSGIVERWQRLSGAATATNADLRSWEPAADLDRAAFGTDRSRLLESLAASGAASLPGLGYAMGRPGSKAAYFGPCVAAHSEVCERLLGWFLARHASEAVYWDVLQSNREAAALASRYGFTPVRTLTRMFRGPVIPSDHSLVFAIAGFEYG
jgi:ribosomal protein S18 acetylase RimI-like enzyme